jgi:hypothetical protein
MFQNAAFPDQFKLNLLWLSAFIVDVFLVGRFGTVRKLSGIGHFWSESPKKGRSSPREPWGWIFQNRAKMASFRMKHHRHDDGQQHQKNETVPEGCESTIMLIRHCEKGNFKSHCNYVGHEQSVYLAGRFGNAKHERRVHLCRTYQKLLNC